MVNTRKILLALVDIFLVSMSIYDAVSEIIAKPRDTEAVVGDLTYLNCSTSEPLTSVTWYYYPVGTEESTYIYLTGNLIKNYESRARLEKLNAARTFNLVFPSVQITDAGEYFCQEESGQQDKGSAQLIVLDSSPLCGSNTKGHEVIGPNSCGLQTERVRLSCKATYSGNIPPAVDWIKDDAEFVIKGVHEKNHSRNITSFLTLHGNISEDGAYRCQTKRSAMAQYRCSPQSIKTISFVNNVTTVEKKKGESGHCIANSSHPCTYKWTWSHDDQEETVGNEYNTTYSKPGVYRCNAECTIRETKCTVVAGFVWVSPEERIQNLLLLLLLLIFLLIPINDAVVVMCTRRAKSSSKGAGDRVETGQVLQPEAVKNGCEAKKTLLQKTEEEYCYDTDIDKKKATQIFHLDRNSEHSRIRRIHSYNDFRTII